VMVTLMLVMVLFGDRLGLRRPPAVQIPRRSREAIPPLPPGPQPSEELAAPHAGIPAQAPPPPEDVLKGLDPDERNNIRVYARVNKSVVNITTEATGFGFFGDETSTGSGSGFVIDKAGHIMTNYHVIQGADSVRATLYDGSAHEAQFIGADAAN